MNKKSIIIFSVAVVLTAYFNFFNQNKLLAINDKVSGIISVDDTLQEKTAEQVYKNIQVLKGLPASKLHTVMRFIAFSLGVRCDYCHVTADKGPWPMEKDDKKTKGTAREMITMMKKINDDNFESRQEVNCATCHKGNPKPVSYPPFSMEKYEIKVNKDSLPDASVIIDKYIQVIGGKSAFDKIKTRKISGDIIENGKTQPMEIQQSAPDKYYISRSSEWGPTSVGYNGTKGWIKMPVYQGALDEDDLIDVKKDGEFYKEINIGNYTKMKVTGMQKIPSFTIEGAERTAYEVRGVDNFGNFVKLYFDTETGLLLREIYFKQNPFGSIAIETDYDDYRDVDGIKLPFAVNHRTPDSNEIMKINEIKDNLTIEDSVFEMPKK